MSSLLEEAIVDAAALKEAAMKNAEKSILERYSPKIKEAVDSMLEQDDFGLEDDEMMMDDELGLGDMGDEDREASDVLDQVPMAATDGEKLCPCPEEDDEIEVDFDELEAAMSDGEDLEPGAIDREEFADDLEDLDDLVLDEDIDEEVDLDESELNALAEELEIDVDVVPNGVQGANSMEQEEAEDIRLAKETAAEAQKERDKQKEKVSVLENKISKVLKQNKTLKEHLYKFKNKLEEISLDNARLLYKNRILDSDSLNERQKRKYVETIAEAKSVNEAKTIYRTLLCAADEGNSGKRKMKPSKSLSEAINRGPSLILNSTKGDKDAKEDSNALRWKELAGIK